jgi:hypothetical protein
MSAKWGINIPTTKAVSSILENRKPTSGFAAL